MKKNTHPPYQEVLFVDSSTGAKFLIGTTLQPKDTETFEGKSYPVVRVPISSASHPFFTKTKQFVDSDRRVKKFTDRYERKVKEVQKAQEKEEEAKKASEAKKKKGKGKK